MGDYGREQQRALVAEMIILVRKMPQGGAGRDGSRKSPCAGQADAVSLKVQMGQGGVDGQGLGKRSSSRVADRGPEQMDHHQRAIVHERASEGGAPGRAQAVPVIPENEFSKPRVSPPNAFELLHDARAAASGETILHGSTVGRMRGALPGHRCERHDDGPRICLKIC
jgi:hypothetical protein